MAGKAFRFCWRILSLLVLVAGNAFRYFRSFSLLVLVAGKAFRCFRSFSLLVLAAYLISFDFL